MTKLEKTATSLIQTVSPQGLLEYALVGALVALIVVTATNTLSHAIASAFQSISDRLTQAVATVLR